MALLVLTSMVMSPVAVRPLGVGVRSMFRLVVVDMEITGSTVRFTLVSMLVALLTFGSRMRLPAVRDRVKQDRKTQVKMRTFLIWKLLLFVIESPSLELFHVIACIAFIPCFLLVIFPICNNASISVIKRQVKSPLQSDK